MIISEKDYLEHYGTLHKSGRYPWGSGNDQPARHQDFVDYVNTLRKEGLTEKEVADGFGISIARLRARYSINRNEAKAALISQAERLRDKGNSHVAIGKIMGKNESSIRALLADGEKAKADSIKTVANMLKEEVDSKGLIDVSAGVENHIGISATKLATAVAVLQEQGYEVRSVPVPQLGTGKNTNTKVLAPPGTSWGQVVKNRLSIRQISQIDKYSEDDGTSFLGISPPIKINPKRVDIVYGPDGGTKADGVIFVRPGVSDVALGKSQYAQVRIAVGNGHYLKGMAMYKDGLPDGIDLAFNTNKENTGNKLDAMKKIEKDSDNPFGATVRQQYKKDAKGNYITDKNGNKILASSMNLVHEEGDWSDWSKTVSTQFLSKQSPSLAKSQLDMTFEQKKNEFDRLSKLTNPTVKKILLEKFGDETDSSAVHLEAAGINKRQGWHVILPISSMPPTQVYAPNFKDGERVVLVRFPHAGRFEIPELVVNNNHRESKRLLGNAKDAVGIHPSVAERLSGADFDGDTVLVIPNNSNKISTSPALEGLKNFNPRTTYRAYPGMPEMTPHQKGIEMGKISNLISDMQIKGANTTELAAAVRHSMVVIDAEKHHLNYKQSAVDNGITHLKEKYQGGSRAGAATLISRATAENRVNQRKPRPAALGGAIDKETGRRVFVDTNDTNFKTGKPSTEKSTRLAETHDARTLLSDDGIGTRMERLYADHSNKLKGLANEARKESVNIPPAKYSKSAKVVYDAQVKSLNGKLFLAKRNAPLERQAQVVAGAIVKIKRDAEPNLDTDRLKKIKGQALETARIRTGAKKHQIVIEQDEWNAIQAGAISDSRLRSILQNADLETVRKLATPRPEHVMTSAKINRAKTMLASGYTRAEVADQLGVSLTTLDVSTTQELV